MRMKTKLLFLFSSLLVSVVSSEGKTQNVRLTLNKAIEISPNLSTDLQQLCDEIGGRVTGSIANEQSVEWAYDKFKKSGVKTWKQPFEMPVMWDEKASKFRISGELNFRPLAVSKYQTKPGNYIGELIEVGMGSKEEIEKVSSQLKGNFALVETDLCFDIEGLFNEYVHAAKVEQLLRGKGVKGIVFMASRPQKLLYRFIPSRVTENDLPQFIMAREDAKRCQRSIRNGKRLNFLTTVNAEIGGEFTSTNVLAEIPGGELKDEIVLIGAHLDSWALGTGANDNGCNVVMLIDIARQMNKLNLKPKRTIRFALWNGEEQGYFGSWAYNKKYQSSLDDHKVAMSVDIGSGEIIGFFTNGREDLTQAMEKLLAPINQDSSLTMINVPIIGTDNFDFMLEGIPNLVASHKPASYGVNYHASSDTYDKVDFESLKKNQKLVASLLWMYANDQSGMLDLPRQNRAEIQRIFDEHETEFSMRMFNVWESWVDGKRGRKN